MLDLAFQEGLVGRLANGWADQEAACRAGPSDKARGFEGITAPPAAG
jgi:hypothetical protein